MGNRSFERESGARKFLRTLLLILFSPFLIAAVFVYFAWGAMLYLTIWLRRKDPFVIFVYSNSPIWKDYIENEILPSIKDHAMILNWSERRNWKSSLPVLAIQYFSGYRNFNPMGMVFRPFRWVKIYRFFKAFQEFKHGNIKSVEELKREMLRELGPGHPAARR